ncbi:MAG TPA: ComEC/Rec2 family competence protein, partial [Pyrinomonadaceae bacterium]|nr:ComEC/Rec2 family competence protein [Pyrinomonadaceae bacterium]
CLVCGLVAGALALCAFAGRRLAAASYLTIVAFAFAGTALGRAQNERAGESRVRSFYESGEIASGEPVELTGVLERAPERTPDGLLIALGVERWRFKNSERDASGRVELFAPVRDARTRAAYARLELRRGARIRVMSALRRAENFRNPGVSSFTEYLDAKDVDARGMIKSVLLVERLDDERVLWPLVLLDRWRDRLTGRIDALFTPETASVLNASMLGNRYGLSRSTAERFREGGTFHVLVISGLHITFIGGVVWGAARVLTRRRLWQWALATVFVWSYAIAVGAEPSVVRAALTFTAVALAPVLGRRSNMLNALGGAALALLVWRTGNLFDPSFQLTFLSVLAIAALAWPLLVKLKEIGEWRPTRATPHPPACPLWLLSFCETLFWSERKFRREMARSIYSYQLFKTPLAAPLERWRVQAFLRFVFAAVLVSIVVQLVLLPLLVLYFHRLSLAAPLLNVIVGALMGVLSFAALAAAGLSQMGDGLAAPFVQLAEASNWLMTHSVDPFAEAHIASLRLPEYSGAATIFYGLYYLPLAALISALSRWRPVGVTPAPDIEQACAARNSFVKASVAGFVAMLAVIVVHPLSAGRPDGRLRIDFLDVGQGDSALLTMPDGTTLLIDGGGRPRFDTRGFSEDDEGSGDLFERDSRGVGGAVVSEYLWWRGLDRVDFVLATHADADHMDGLNDVARNFKVGAALVGRAPPSDDEYTRFAASSKREGVPVYLVGRGDSFRFGEVTADVLWPPRVDRDSSAPSRNDDSLVLRVRLRRRTFLLTGDIESAAESALVNAHDNLACDAVKVAHHGSRTSSTEAFVKATRTRLAVMSVGLDSPYGHPHAEVLERWRAQGADIFTTGERGTITLSTDGEDLEVETFVTP